MSECLDCLWYDSELNHCGNYLCRNKSEFEKNPKKDDTVCEEKLYTLYGVEKNGDLVVEGYAYGEDWVEQALWMNDLQFRTPEEAKEWWEKHGKH